MEGEVTGTWSEELSREGRLTMLWPFIEGQCPRTVAWRGECHKTNTPASLSSCPPMFCGVFQWPNPTGRQRARKPFDAVHEVQVLRHGVEWERVDGGLEGHAEGIQLIELCAGHSAEVSYGSTHSGTMRTS